MSKRVVCKGHQQGKEYWLHDSCQWLTQTIFNLKTSKREREIIFKIRQIKEKENRISKSWKSRREGGFILKLSWIKKRKTLRSLTDNKGIEKYSIFLIERKKWELNFHYKLNSRLLTLAVALCFWLVVVDKFSHN